MRILLVEDEEKIAQHISDNLISSGYNCHKVVNGEDAIESILIDGYDLVILDRMLPDMDGLTVCNEVRSKGYECPILMLTSLAGIDDIIEGLDMGADDYLTKPFNMNELLARIKVLLRRRSLRNLPELSIRNIKLDSTRRTAVVGKKPIQLSQREYVLLEYLMRNAGKPLTRLQLLDHVWDTHQDSNSNLVDVYIKYLRNKIDSNKGKKSNIETLRGYGYKFREE